MAGKEILGRLKGRGEWGLEPGPPGPRRLQFRGRPKTQRSVSAVYWEAPLDVQISLIIGLDHRPQRKPGEQE